MKTYFEKGDRIVYQYIHWLNSKSSTTITKYGVFLRKVKQKPHQSSWGNPKVVIQVDGNKSTSTILLSQIKHDSRFNTQSIKGE